jgi:hypothetical protein
MTDYVATTTQSGTQSANHPFDLILLALTESEFSEEVAATLHEGDTYFSNCKLSAWKLWYSLDNDTTRFAWADAVTGKGVIYRMIDEFNNDVPYDFKCLQYQFRPSFKVHSSYGAAYYGMYIPTEETKTISGTTYYKWNRDLYISGPFTPPTELWTTVSLDNISTDMSVYIISGDVVSSVSFTIFDVTTDNYDTFTFDVNGVDASLLVAQNCYANKIKPYTVDGVMQLNKIIFRTVSSSNLQCYSNTFDYNCHSNTFQQNCYNNTFSQDCDNNTFQQICDNNTFGQSCRYNTFKQRSQYNTFGSNCHSNTFGSNCHSNTFGQNCQNNTFGPNCQNNTFGQDCRYNAFDNSCCYNAFGNSCCYILFGSASDALKSYCRYIIIESGNRNIYLNPTGTTAASAYYQNVKISQGINNTNTYKTITDPNVGQTYQTIYKTSNDTEINV